MKIRVHIVLALMLAMLATAITNAAQTPSLSSSFCSGSGATGGLIPATSIISSATSGQQSVLSISLLIMLIMLLIFAVLYMVGVILQMDLFQKIIKQELGEVIVTFLVIFILVGIVASATYYSTQTSFFVAGSNFGRNLFVSDCTYLSSYSTNFFAPLFLMTLMSATVRSVSGVTIQIEPVYFGFKTSPLLGYSILGSTLGILTDIAGAFILLILSAATILGIIYGLFPIFLYAGIVLRTIPWTRAAGGAFLGLFVGFYIVFPIVLHIMLAGYTPPITISGSINAVDYTQFTNSLSKNPVLSTVVTQFLNFLSTEEQLLVTLAQYGLVNGFIAAVIEPGFFTILAIIIAFLISYDVAEIMADMLGAPSMTTSAIFSKVLK